MGEYRPWILRERHGFSRSPEHRTWSNMRNRCMNPRNKSFAQYGARGITVDPRWDSFSRFLADMGPKPSRLHTIERVDNAKSYGPENCRWATRLEQANNKSNNRPITFNGKTQNLSQWAREIGLLPDTLERRLNGWGWSIERALTTPHRGW